MKAIIIKVISFLFLILLLDSCLNEPVEVPKLKCNQPNLTANKTVQQLQKNAGAIVAQYLYDDVIEAYVISTEEHGNFFKNIYFQTLATPSNPAVGFSVPVDVTNTYVDYRLGNKVFVKLKNQFTDINYGGLRVGSIYVNSFNEGGVGRLSQNDYKNVLHASCTTLTEEQLVRSFSIADVLQDTNLNTLVELSDVQFTDTAIGRHYFEETNNIGGATNWNLIDKAGNQIIFRTSSFADFATKIVPSGRGKVRGVLTKYATDYQLVARSENDVVISGKSATPFFSEDFQKVVDNTNISLAGWANIAQSGSLVWKGGLFSGNGFAEFAISGTKVASNIAWLITPKIDMDIYTHETLTFRAAQHHLDVDSPLNSLTVYVSNNFDGLNVTKATWVPVSVNLPKQATPWYQFVGSGGVDLSSYTGKINIAFKYTGSGKNQALDGAFQIDDVQIFGDK